MGNRMLCSKKRFLPHLAYNAFIVIMAATCIVAVPLVLFAQEQNAPAKASGRAAGHSPFDYALSTWVGPGDVLRIKAFPDTGSFISGNYVILDSGYIVLPILGRVEVTRFSIPVLTANLTDGYSKYLAYPNIQIEPLIHLSFLGGFLDPGMHLVNPLHPFSSALRSAGGTVRDDGLELLRWERDGKVLSKDLTEILEGAESLWAVGFKSNDQVCVTLRTRRDPLPVASFIVSSIISTATLGLTILVVLLQ